MISFSYSALSFLSFGHSANYQAKTFGQMKINNRRSTVIDDMAALRAFVLPDNYPFILEVYKKDGKTEAALQADIKAAREKYKELSSLKKKETVRPSPADTTTTPQPQ